MILRLLIIGFCVLGVAMPAGAESVVARGGAVAPKAQQNMDIPQALLDLAAENENIIIDYYSDTLGAIEPAAGESQDEAADDDALENVGNPGASAQEPLYAPAQ